MAQESHADTRDGGGPRPNPVRRRRAPGEAEQKRRKAFGADWGQVAKVEASKRREAR